MEGDKIEDRMTGGGDPARMTGTEGPGNVGALSAPGTMRDLETAEGLGTYSEFEKEARLSEDSTELKFLGGMETCISTVKAIGTGESFIGTPSVL